MKQPVRDDLASIEQPSQLLLRQQVQISEEIARYIREQIMLGLYPPGHQLNIDRLASTFGVSSTPIRDALTTLRAEGFVNQMPRKGFRVAALQVGDIHDISLMLQFVAGEMAARAATFLSPEELDELGSLQEEMGRAKDRQAFEEVEELDFRFHRTIHRASRSPKLQWILRALTNYFPRSFAGQIPGALEATIEHKAILRALRRRDADLARRATVAHFKVAERLLVDRIKALEKGDEEAS